MSNSLALPYLNSTLSLSARLADITNVFVIPALCVLVIPLKLISMLVLVLIIRKKKKENCRQFYYLLTYETCDLIQSIVASLGAILRCGPYCNFGYNFVTKLFDLVFYTYGVPVCLQIQTFMEITFSLERIKALKITIATTDPQTKFKIKLAICLTMSLIVAVPNYLMSRSIQPVGILISSNQTLYVISTRSFVQTYYWALGLSVFNIIRGFVLMLILFFVNIVLIYKFNAYNKHRISTLETQFSRINETLNRQKKKTIGISRLVLGMNTIYLVGNLPNSMSPIFFLIFGGQSQIYAYYSTATSILLLFSHFFYFFIYIFLNRSFRKTLLSAVTQ